MLFVNELIHTKGELTMRGKEKENWKSKIPAVQLDSNRCERPNTLLVEPLPERPSNRNAKRLTVTVGDKGTLGLQMFGLMTDGCGTGTGSGGMASAPAWCHLHPSASPHLHNTLHNGADRVGYSGHGSLTEGLNDYQTAMPEDDAEDHLFN
ncbi:hypothetical protein KOW79_001661 [Hemibagrus wyckioides]|uniref:Uncharacterized protein n=1 Tax=Hemibagrus wyckioides TaxID=337641 RepID=A0A9D3P5F7_9TELE|nr:hypothetical protein KOW79_001661 [Hemibagrus wyckioides]